jgi:hypothetical protein
LSAVVDLNNDRCFVKALDYRRVLDLNVASDQLQRPDVSARVRNMCAYAQLQSNYYTGESRVVRETYRVVRQYDDVPSPIIHRFCATRPTFMLNKVRVNTVPLMIIGTR